VRATSTVHPKQHQPAPHSAAGSAGTALFALIFVIGLIVVLGKLAKRMPGIGAASGRKGLRLVASLPLGPKDRVMVVEVGGKQLLVGVGEGGPRLIHTLDNPLPEEEAKQPASFAQIFSQLRTAK
jgi:flagellar protein FliO/FliZ